MPRVAKQVGVYERDPGSGIWYARYFVNGRKVQKSFGRDRQAASDFLKDQKAKQRLSPDDFKRHQMRNGKSTTISELCDLLREHIKDNPKYKDQKNPFTRMRQIEDAFGKRAADSLSPPEIDAWLRSRKKMARPIRGKKVVRQTEQQIAPATANRLRSTFSRLYRRGIYLGKVDRNPVRDVEPSATPTGKPNWLRPEQKERLYAVLRKKVDDCLPHRTKLRLEALHRIYELDVALGTGMRKGEQYGLRWTDVELSRKVIHLHDTKNGESRDVFMNNTVHSAMKALWEMNGEVYSERPGYVFRCEENKKWWLAALKEAGLEGQLRWHDLRHTFATTLVQKGANLKKVQVACGHKTIAMTARYAHVDDADQRDTVALLD